MNEEINEEWLDDKSRFACDGLKRQRLTVPLMKDNQGRMTNWKNIFYETSYINCCIYVVLYLGELKPCGWEDAIVSVAKVLDSTPADRMAAIAGGLVDAEVFIF